MIKVLILINCKRDMTTFKTSLENDKSIHFNLFKIYIIYLSINTIVYNLDLLISILFFKLQYHICLYFDVTNLFCSSSSNWSLRWGLLIILLGVNFYLSNLNFSNLNWLDKSVWMYWFWLGLIFNKVLNAKYLIFYFFVAKYDI